MKLWNCVNIRNINFASEIFPLEKDGKFMQWIVLWELKGENKKGKRVKILMMGNTRTGQSVHADNGQQLAERGSQGWMHLVGRK